MREIDTTELWFEFIDSQPERMRLKFFQLIKIISEVKVVHANFLKKLQSTPFYELRIKAGDEYRIIIFSIDHHNFTECTKAVCLNGFQKKSTKDYNKAVTQAEKKINEYNKEK